MAAREDEAREGTVAHLIDHVDEGSRHALLHKVHMFVGCARVGQAAGIAYFEGKSLKEAKRGRGGRYSVIIQR
jgi:hypothetical protein